MEEISEFLDTLGKSIQQAKKDADSLKPILNEIDKTTLNLLEVKEKLNNAMLELENDDITRKSVDSLLQSVEEIKISTLVKHLSEAINSSSEFNDPVFAPYLLQAASKDEALIITLQYAGTSSKIDVENNMNAVAGSLEDWGKAVSAVRGDSKSSPNKASSSWANLFRSKDSNSLWESIERERGIFSGKIAPFWEILDKGHASIRLSSDRGGYPTPSEAPSHFIDSTTKEIEESFKRRLSGIKSSVTRAKNKLKSKISKVDMLLIELENLIDFADSSMGEIAENISDENPAVSKVLEKINNRYSKAQTSISQEKLQKVVSELLETGEVSSYYINPDGRIEVTATGSPNRARVNVNTLLQIIAEG